MTPEEESEPKPSKDEKCTRPLLCSEEWEEPAGRKVLGEYHKPGLSDEDAQVEADLDSFERYWREKHGINLRGEYHKSGAPYMEEPSGWEGHRSRAGQVPPGVIVDEVPLNNDIHIEERAHIAEEAQSGQVVQEVHVEERIHAEEEGVTAPEDTPVVPEKVFVEEVHIEDTQQVVKESLPTAPPKAREEPKVEVRATLSHEPAADVQPAGPAETGPQAEPPASQGESGKAPLRISEVVDLSTIEMASYVLFRAIFGKQVDLPIKKDGLVDIDVHVKGKDITVNSNQLYFAFPELVIWHITYTHKGRPVLEIGRGVENGLRVRYGGAIRLVLEVWAGNRRAAREKKAAKAKGMVQGSGDKGS